MPDLNDLIHRLENFKEDITRSLPDIATSISLTAKAIAERTIKDHGFGMLYSTKAIPTIWLRQNILNGQGASFLDRIDQEYDELGLDGEASWKAFRDAQGLQTGFVDLTYSGEMWSGMQPMDPKEHGENWIAPLGNINRDGQDKMNYNAERYGDFIGKALEEGENMAVLKQVGQEEVSRILQRNNI
jgi:hypothetical protein